MEFEAYGIGLCSASVCTSLSVDEAVVKMNEENPTGISSNWSLSADTHFHGGTYTNGCDCPDYPGNKHYLLNC